MRKTLFASVVLFLSLALPASAQDRPNLKWPTIAYLAGAGLDTASTNHNLRMGGPELNPTLKWANNDTTVITATLIGEAALVVYLTHRWAPTHPKLMKTALYAFGSVRLFVGVNNLTGHHVTIFPR